MEDESLFAIFCPPIQVVLLPRAHAQGVMRSVCPSVVRTKTAGSGDIGMWANCNGNETIKNSKKLGWFGLESNKKWPRRLQIFGLAYQPHLQLTTCFLAICTSTILFVFVTMDLRRERKRSLKVLEQQEAEFERIEATKKRHSHTG
jgi:hypothetical protein